MSSMHGVAKTTAVLLVLCVANFCFAEGARPYATEQEMFGTLQGLKGERAFGQVGVTGLKLRIYEGLSLTVEGTLPGTPAEGRFKKGEVIKVDGGQYI